MLFAKQLLTSENCETTLALQKTNIQRHKRETFSCTGLHQALLTLSNTYLVCNTHTATILSQRNWMKSVSFQIKNYGCAKENPSDKNQV